MLNFLYSQSYKIPRKYLAVLLLFVVLTLTIISTKQVASLLPYGNKTDLLAYSIAGAGKKNLLMLYDPSTGISVPVHADKYHIGFSISRNGDLAFSSGPDDNRKLSILNIRTASLSTLKVASGLDAVGEPLSWSPDGRYLAFTSHLGATHSQIYIWDGKTAINISPDTIAAPASDDSSWSFDDRLAFTEYFGNGQSKADPSEIYLWDGKSTHDLSQNPVGEDRAPSWSANGQLAFLSYQNGKEGVYVWDGVSVSIKNHSPDASTFVHIAPGLTNWDSYPAWTNNSKLAFGASGNLYLWDGQTATNISQNPNAFNGFPVWNSDGRWAFPTPFSQGLIYVRDNHNRTILTVKGESPAWNSNGYLTFCTLGWTLSIMNGQQVSSIAHGYEILSQWQSGSRNICSSG